MIARSFKSVAWVAAIGAAALICYMFSLRGAAERADLVQLDRDVVRLQQSIRTLQTELGTRGRIDQLQHWASADFGFAAPVASQFVADEMTLARLDQPTEPAPLETPVRMAQAPATPSPAAPSPAAPPVRTAPAPAPAPALPRVIQAAAPQRNARPAPAAAPQPILHRASAATPTRAAPRPAASPVRAATRAAATAPVQSRPIVSEGTLRDLSARERAERSRAGAN